MTFSRLLLNGLAFLFSPWQLALASGDPTVVTIPVNIAYSTDSLWSAEEIQKRVQYTNSILATACVDLEIVIEVSQALGIDEPNLQDVGGWMTVDSVNQLKLVLGKFDNPIRPFIFYARQAAIEGWSELSDHLAQAYTFGGPRVFTDHVGLAWNGFSFDTNDPLPFTSGNLDWNRFEELKSIHGITVIAQGNSENHPFKVGDSDDNKYSVDVHELGHILLNDGGHRYSPQNILGAKDRKRFDPDQCLLIKHYHEREAGRFQAVKAGMKAICDYAESENLDGRPNYCKVSK